MDDLGLSTIVHVELNRVELSFLFFWEWRIRHKMPVLHLEWRIRHKMPVLHLPLLFRGEHLRMTIRHLGFFLFYFRSIVIRSRGYCSSL